MTGLSWELSLSDTARTAMHEWRAGEAGRLFRLLVTDLSHIEVKVALVVVA